MPDTTASGLPSPRLGEDADGPTAFRALALAIDAIYGGAVDAVADLPPAGAFNGQRVYITGTGETAVWDHVLGAWTGVYRDFTPQWTAGVTLGTGSTNTGRVVVHGRLVTAKFRLVLGTGGSFPAPPTMGFPTGLATAEAALQALGAAIANDNSGGSAARRALTVYQNGASVQFLATGDAAGTKIVDTSVPFTWAAADTLTGTLVYELAV